MYCKPQLTFHETTGKLSVMVGTKNTGGKHVEDVVITIPFPACVSSVSMDSAFGTVSYDDMTKVQHQRLRQQQHKSNKSRSRYNVYTHRSPSGTLARSPRTRRRS